jgi:hypothetical protein
MERFEKFSQLIVASHQEALRNHCYTGPTAMARLLSFLWQRVLPALFVRRKDIVAVLLAFTLTTHPFWCAMNFWAGSNTQLGRTLLVAPAALAQVTKPPASATISTVTASPIPYGDVCCGNADERAVLNASSPAALPELLLVLLPLLWVALLLVFIPLLPRGAMVFGRDGPVRVRPLHSRLIRASLPHRAPPVLLF